LVVSDSGIEFYLERCLGH